MHESDLIGAIFQAINVDLVDEAKGGINPHEPPDKKKSEQHHCIPNTMASAPINSPICPV